MTRDFPTILPIPTRLKRRDLRDWREKDHHLKKRCYLLNIHLEEQSCADSLKKREAFFFNSNGQRRLFLNNAHKSAENQGSFHLGKKLKEKGVKTVNALTPFIFWAWWCFWSGSRLCIDCILLGENCQHVGNTNWELYVMCVLKNKWGLMLSRQGSFILRKRALSLRLLFFLRKIPKRALSSIRLGFLNNKRILSTILVGKYGHTYQLKPANTKLNC